MTLIVADTGPINYLILTGCVNVLPKLMTTVVLPELVVRELQAAGAPDAVREWVHDLPGWIEVRKPAGMIAEQPELSRADRAAVSIARELHALLLVDDRRARCAASEHAVQTIGTLGILEAAAAKGLISLPLALGKLQATSMFISDDLVA